MNRPSEKRAQRKKDSKINFSKPGKNAREDGKRFVCLSFSFLFCSFSGFGLYFLVGLKGWDNRF
jgi:hypothetical protein